MVTVYQAMVTVYQLMVMLFLTVVMLFLTEESCYQRLDRYNQWLNHSIFRYFSHKNRVVNSLHIV